MSMWRTRYHSKAGQTTGSYEALNAALIKPSVQSLRERQRIAEADQQKIKNNLESLWPVTILLYRRPLL